jgi:predicted transcriptional regulator
MDSIVSDFIETCTTDTHCDRCGGTGRKVQQIKLGHRLRGVRLSASKTQLEVANALQISTAFLYDLEFGRRHWSIRLVEGYLKACSQ